MTAGLVFSGWRWVAMGGVLRLGGRFRLVAVGRWMLGRFNIIGPVPKVPSQLPGLRKRSRMRTPSGVLSGALSIADNTACMRA